MFCKFASLWCSDSFIAICCLTLGFSSAMCSSMQSWPHRIEKRYKNCLVSSVISSNPLAWFDRLWLLSLSRPCSCPKSCSDIFQLWRCNPNGCGQVWRCPRYLWKLWWSDSFGNTGLHLSRLETGFWPCYPMMISYSLLLELAFSLPSFASCCLMTD